MHFILRMALLVCVCCTFTFAQQLISVGVKGGFPLTDWYADTAYPPVQTEFFASPTRSYNSSKNYVVGAVVELNLPLHLSVELDGLYRPLSSVYQYSTRAGSGGYSVNTDSWEFPVLAKYHFGSWKAKPFIDAGPSFRVVGESRSRFISKNGVAAGAGVGVRVFRLRFEPEVRYTYWAADLPATAYAHFGSHHNQAEFLVGLLF